MLNVADARHAILAETTPLPPRALALADAWNCVLAEELTAASPLPAWDNSAVDGYAVRAADVVGASENNPLHLRVAGEIPAGAMWTDAAGLPAQGCLRIFTGAPIPPGADAVVMQEDTRPHHAGDVAVLEAVDRGENIRRAGEDVAAGAVALAPGTLLDGAALALAAAVGRARVLAHPPPRIGVLVTGAEVIEPGAPLRAGQIFNSNTSLLMGLTRAAGCAPVDLGIADDHREDLREQLDYGLSECDALITTGGVSVGAHDLVKEALVELGCQQKFWKVAMKPGQPVVFATRGARLAFGLPGNPVSAAVTFLTLARPALLRLRGLTELELPTVTATTAAEFVNRGDRTHFMRGRVARQADGGWAVTPLGRQGSHMLTSLTEANCLVEVAPCRTIARGATTPVMLISAWS